MTRTENFQSQFFFQSFSGNHFSPRFMVPCSLYAENIFSVFRSPHLPLDTPRWSIRKVQLQLSWTFLLVYKGLKFSKYFFFIISRKYFFGFLKSAPTPRYTILDSRLPPCNAISEGRLSLCNTSSEAGALPSEVRIENDSDRKFSKSIFFQSISGNHFSPRFMVPCSLLAENIFSVFRSPHLPLDTLIKKSSYSGTNQKVQL